MKMLKWLATRIQNTYWVRRIAWWIIGPPDLYLLVRHKKCDSQKVGAGTTWKEGVTFDCHKCNCLTNEERIELRLIPASEAPNNPLAVLHAVF
ncbi:MAG: hypothetical protein ABH837_01330 [bacterium]